MLGTIVPVDESPETNKSAPTRKFFVIAAPPDVIILPLSKLVESVVSVTIIPLLTLIFPTTSNASVGLILLMPTDVPVAVIVSTGLPPELVLIKILEPSVLLLRTVAPLAVVVKEAFKSEPIVTPELFLTLKLKLVVLATSPLKKLLASSPSG